MTPCGCTVSTGQRKGGIYNYRTNISTKEVVAMTWSRDRKLSCMETPSRDHKQVKGTGQGQLWSREFVAHSQGAGHSSANTGLLGKRRESSRWFYSNSWGHSHPRITPSPGAGTRPSDLLTMDKQQHRASVRVALPRLVYRRFWLGSH